MTEVSVIIPCYNCAAYVSKCLFALERQTYRDFEVLCIDDCSKDATAQTIEEIAQKVSYPLRLIRSSENHGPAYSRNLGIAQADGRLLAFCDSDDWYDEDYLALMHAALLSQNADLVMCEYRKIYEDDRAPTEMHYLKGCSRNRLDLMAWSKAAMWLLMFKKELTKDLEVPDLRNGEDIAYVPCLESRAPVIAVVEKPLYNYQMRKGSASKTPSEAVYKSLLTAFEFISTHFAADAPQVLEYLGVRTILYGAVLNACKAGEKSDAVRKMIDAFQSRFPSWPDNPYLFLFGRQKRFFLNMVKNKKIGLCRLYARMHQRFSV